MHLDERATTGGLTPLRDPGREQIARRVCVAVLAVGLPAAAATAWLPELASLRLRFAVVLVGIIAIIAGVALNRPQNRRPWLILAVGLTSSLVGDALVLGASRDGGVATNLPADAWLTAAAGLLILAAMVDATRIVRGNDHGGTLDAIVFALAVGTTVWHLGVVGQAVPGWVGGGTEIAGSLQILFLVAVLGLLVRTARVLPQGSRTVMVLLAFGLIGAITAFLIGAFREATGEIGSHYAGARAAFGAGANLLAGAAALHPSMQALVERQVPPVDRMSVPRLVMLGLGLLVPPMLLVTSELRGTPGSAATLFLAWSVLVPAVLARIKLLGNARDEAWRRATSTEQRMAALVANTGDALLIVNPSESSGDDRSLAAAAEIGHVESREPSSPREPCNWTITYASPAASRQVGLGPADLEGRPIGTIVDDDDQPVLAELLAAGAHQLRTADVRATGFGHDPRWLEIVVDELHDVGGDDGLVLTIRDVTDRKRAQIHWEHAAVSDVLTGLLNRRGIESQLDTAFELAVADESLLGIIVADLDGFKAINDTHGHVAGDEVLRQVAARLTSAVRGDDAVGRIGGDEFVVVSRDVESQQALLRMAQRIPEIIRRPIYIDRLELSVDISLGVAMADVERDSAGQLIRRADAALYRAKAAGRGQVALATDVEAIGR